MLVMALLPSAVTCLWQFFREKSKPAFNTRFQHKPDDPNSSNRSNSNLLLSNRIAVGSNRIWKPNNRDLNWIEIWFCPTLQTVVKNIYFPNIHQNLHALMHLRTYRSFCGGPAVDACMRADAAARRAARGKRHELPLCRRFRTVSKYVRVSADALTAANRTRGTVGACGESFSACA